MSRTGCLVLIALAFLCAVPAAQAAAPIPTVSADGASSSLKRQWSTLYTDDPFQVTSGDAGPEAPPSLAVTPGAVLTVTLDAPADGVSARLAAVPLTVERTGERTYTIQIPETRALPAHLALTIDSSEPGKRWESGWTLDLVAPAPPVAPAVATPTPAVTAGVKALHLSGRRLTATVDCSGPCAGVLTLRTSKLRIARVEFTRSGPLKTTIRAAALRHLKRHRTKSVRAVLTLQGRAPQVLQLPLA